MNYKTLDLEQRGSSAWLWMNVPARHNAFDETLIHELTELVTLQDANRDIRAIVLAGRGKSFSAGADLEWMRRQGEGSADDNLADATRLATLFRVIAECKKPTLARVHGAAIGGGLGLAAACDICVATEKAFFATSEVRLGVIPSVISPYVLRAIGARQCLRYFQTGERMSAAKALELGLAHEVCADDQLDSTLDALIGAIAAGGPEAQAKSSALIRDIADRPLTDALVEDTARRIAEVRSSPEAREGLNAFLEKRAPVWKVT